MIFAVTTWKLSYSLIISWLALQAFLHQMICIYSSVDNTDDQPSDPFAGLIDADDTLFGRSIPIQVLEDALYCQDINGLNTTCNFQADDIPAPSLYRLPSGETACQNVVIRV